MTKTLMDHYWSGLQHCLNKIKEIPAQERGDWQYVAGLYRDLITQEEKLQRQGYDRSSDRAFEPKPSH